MCEVLLLPLKMACVGYSIALTYSMAILCCDCSSGTHVEFIDAISEDEDDL